MSEPNAPVEQVPAPVVEPSAPVAEAPAPVVEVLSAPAPEVEAPSAPAPEEQTVVPVAEKRIFINGVDYGVDGLTLQYRGASDPA